MGIISYIPSYCSRINILSVVISFISLLGWFTTSEMFLLTILSVQRTHYEILSNKMVKSEGGIEEKQFTQVLDHFTLEGQSKTWKQRYFINSNFITTINATKVAIIYIGGEGPQNSAPGGNKTQFDILGQIAQKHQAIIYALEHRFYGKSQPFGNESLSIDHLKYLNTRQALDDLANFVQSMDDEQCKLQNQSVIPGKTCMTWLVAGGSYAGALAAWAIQQYDWLFSGAISSSGVVNTQDFFPEFDQHTFTAAGTPCGPNMLWALRDADFQLAGENRSELLDHFNAPENNMDDFRYFLADSALMALQYGDKHDFCGGMDIAARAFGESLGFVVAYLEEMQYNYADYDRDILKSTQNGSARQWLFQTCTELGYFQPAPIENNIRSDKIDRNYFINLCMYVFNVEITNVTQKVTQMYGGINADDERTFFSNFWQDIWHIAGVSESAQNQKLIAVKDVGHCADLHTISKDDPEELINLRNQEVKFIDELLDTQNKEFQAAPVIFK